jgi:hypothetical protein
VKKAYWTEMMACNSRDCAGIFSVKRGEKGLLDRNDGLHFKGLCWGFQCEKGVKRTTGQNSWPAIHGAVMELFSVKGEIKLIGWNNFIATFLIMLPSLVNIIYHVFALTGRVQI